MYIIRSTGLYHTLDRRETIRNGTFLEKLAVSYSVKIFLWLSKPTVDHSAGGSLSDFSNAFMPQFFKSTYIITLRVKKSYIGSRGIYPRILNLYVVNLTPRPLHPG